MEAWNSGLTNSGGDGHRASQSELKDPEDAVKNALRSPDLVLQSKQLEAIFARLTPNFGACKNGVYQALFSLPKSLGTRLWHSLLIMYSKN